MNLPRSPVPTVFQEYQRLRPAEDKTVFCHAPFSSLHFGPTGDATVCCYNRTHVLGRYPKDSIDEIWFGEPAAALRRNMGDYDVPPGCQLCVDQIRARNYNGLRSFLYEGYSAARTGATVPLPKLMEFEISNLCNLECVMCSGFFSSSIRKNREKLPPAPAAYDDAFVDQLDRYLPSLEDAKFVGGEPFLNRLYFRIWENIAAKKPGMRVAIFTNGSILSPKIKSILSRLNVELGMSVDSVDPENYGKIRVNADYAVMRRNLDWFLEFSGKRGKRLTLLACPLKQNWKDLPEILRFCNERQMLLYFNTVVWPETASLKNLAPTDLAEVIGFLDRSIEFSGTQISMHNARVYRGMVDQLRYWNSSRERPCLDA